MKVNLHNFRTQSRSPYSIYASITKKVYLNDAPTRIQVTRTKRAKKKRKSMRARRKISFRFSCPPHRAGAMSWSLKLRETSLTWNATFRNWKSPLEKSIMFSTFHDSDAKKSSHSSNKLCSHLINHIVGHSAKYSFINHLAESSEWFTVSLSIHPGGQKTLDFP